MPVAEDDYAGCIALICKLENDKPTYEAFKTAMTSGPDTFAKWLSQHGVPAAVASQVASLSGEALYAVAGEVVCKRFW